MKVEEFYGGREGGKIELLSLLVLKLSYRQLRPRRE
jgi:hypothetical protein